MPATNRLHTDGPKADSVASRPFSLTIGKRSSGENSRKRPHSTLDDDSASEDERRNKPQLLSGFDRATGKAITESEQPDEKKSLFIAKQKNRNWRAEAATRRGKNLLPPEEQARRAGLQTEAQTRPEDDESPTYGLLVAQEQSRLQPESPGILPPVKEGMSESKSESSDAEALAALLGDGSKPSALAITSQAAQPDTYSSHSHGNYEFQSDVKSRPDVPSLSSYAAMPIEEFGKALMRGMGWKDGEEIGRLRGTVNKPRDVQRRPALLGIGAKKVPDGLEEIGAWGKGTKKSNKIDRSYMPLVMKNSRTGEMLTEEELQKKQQKKSGSSHEPGGRVQQQPCADPGAHLEAKQRHREYEHRNANFKNETGRRQHEQASHQHRDRSHKRRDRDHEPRSRDRDQDEKRPRHSQSHQRRGRESRRNEVEDSKERIRENELGFNEDETRLRRRLDRPDRQNDHASRQKHREYRNKHD